MSTLQRLTIQPRIIIFCPALRSTDNSLASPFKSLVWCYRQARITAANVAFCCHLYSQSALVLKIYTKNQPGNGKYFLQACKIGGNERNAIDFFYADKPST